MTQGGGIRRIGKKREHCLPFPSMSTPFNLLKKNAAPSPSLKQPDSICAGSE
jgi:hypothetical protein